MTAECPKCGHSDGFEVSHGFVGSDTGYEEWRCPVCRKLVHYEEEQIDPATRVPDDEARL